MQTTAQTTAPPTLSFFIASVTIARSYTEVCVNTSYYVNGICQGLRETNPDDTFACQAQSLDGQECVGGVCICVDRLLRDSCNLTMLVDHALSVEPKVANFRSWIQEIDVVQQPPPAFPFVLILVAVVICAALVLCCIAICLLCFRSKQVVHTGGEFVGIKLL